MLRCAAAVCTLLFLLDCEPGKSLRIGTNIWPGYAPLYLARDRQGWEPGNIRLVEYPSATEVLRAFQGGALEGASLTLDEALMVRESGIPFSVILIHDISQGADVIVARPLIADVKGLRGKRIGVEASALGAFVLTRALEKNRMTSADITIVPIRVNEHEEAFSGGRVDAVVTFEPQRSRLLKAGAHEIFSSREIPGEILDVLIARRDAIEEHSDDLQNVVDGWFEVNRHMQHDASLLSHVANQLKLTPEETRQAYAGIHIPDRLENIRELSGPLEEHAARLGKIMAQKELLRKAPDTRGIADDSFVKRAPEK